MTSVDAMITSPVSGCDSDQRPRPRTPPSPHAQSPRPPSFARRHHEKHEARSRKRILLYPCITRFPRPDPHPRPEEASAKRAQRIPSIAGDTAGTIRRTTPSEQAHDFHESRPENVRIHASVRRVNVIHALVEAWPRRTWTSHVCAAEGYAGRRCGLVVGQWLTETGEPTMKARARHGETMVARKAIRGRYHGARAGNDWIRYIQRHSHSPLRRTRSTDRPRRGRCDGIWRQSVDHGVRH